ncbi:hypothetical protein AYY17_11795 [Morganella psychrotolerans]|uniref:Uncharacterized protein n=1 Tax=Morganella psychrotolerans TaxID=368603 RepID=A0A1B8H1N3_9GAMM|nr:hypothetical protein AYY17_11795 [Morganella psychrotolerans]
MPFNAQSRGVIMMKLFKKYDKKNAVDKPAGFGDDKSEVVKINQENQYIDFRLITQRVKNHVFFARCRYINAAVSAAAFSKFQYVQLLTLL